MSYMFPITTGWSAINVNGSAYLTRTWYYSGTTGDDGCVSPVDITACAYLGAHEFNPGSSLANFVGADAPKIGDFINTYDYTLTFGNVNGRRCIEIIDIIDELTYLTGVVTCPGTFAGDTPPYGNGNFNAYGYVPWGSAPCPCTVPAIVPQGVSVGSHWNSPFALQPVYAQADPIPLSSRFTNCQTCIQSAPFQDCGCTDPSATNFVNQYGSQALQPCCTLCDGTDDNDCCTYTMTGCWDNNAWNFCDACTEDCAGVTPNMGTIWSQTDTSCCRYTCPSITIEATWDCCTYATCPGTFQLHYGPNSDWGIANPGVPTPSVNPHYKFCQERFDGTGQYNSLGGQNGCNWNCKLNPPIIHNTVDTPKAIQTYSLSQFGELTIAKPCPPPDQTSPFYTIDNFCKRKCVDNQGNPLPNAHIDCGCCYPSPSPIVKTKCHCCSNQGQPVMPNNNDYADCSTLDGTLNPSSGMYNCVPVSQQLLCKNSLIQTNNRLTKPMIPTAVRKWIARLGI